MGRAYSMLEKDQHCIENFSRKTLKEMNVLEKYIERQAVLKQM
jgi:hypothetical protein